MTKDEALKLALEALENAEYGDYDKKELNEAITALKAALAQPEQKNCTDGSCDCCWKEPEQEPVAIALNTGTKQGVKWLKNVEHGESLYTFPPQRKPDNKAYTALEQALTRLQKRYGELEAKVAAQQEPVGYVAENGVVDWNVCAPPILTNLYTTPPPQRHWIGLTDEEITDIWAESSPYYHEDDFARAIEAKLRSKNEHV